MLTSAKIKDYIDFVRSGKVPMCKDQFALCDYVEKCFTEESIYVNEQQLDRYLAQQKYFPFKLLPWEIFVFTLHNCTYRSPGVLRWPVLFIYVGRGAGKNGYVSFESFCWTTPINGIKFYNVDIFATAEDQAKTSFEDVYNVLEENSSSLKPFFYWSKELIKNYATGSQIRFRTSGSKTKDGGRPGAIIFDEYHAYENSKLIDVAKTGLGKKAMPRQTIITTDGDVRDGPLDNIKERANQILYDNIDDNGMLPFMCRLDDEEEIYDTQLWPKSNPSYIYLPNLQEEMKTEFEDYKIDPISNSSFMVKRMNMPQTRHDAEVTSWDNILQTNRPVPDLTGKTCVCGIDFTKTTDFMSAVLLFRVKEIYYVLHHSWFCNRSLDAHRIKIPIQDMVKRGMLTIVDDVEVHPHLVTDWINEKRELYDIDMIAIDSYRYALMLRELRDIGYEAKDGKVKLVRPSDIMRVQPKIHSLFAGRNLIWGDDPLMRWFTNNTKLEPAPNNNFKYAKIEEKSRKTDGFMAFVAAMSIEEDIPEEMELGSFEPLIF